jgi:hypothetical protein
VVQREKRTGVPFFWSQHYDVPINYVAHVENWDLKVTSTWKELRSTV